MVKHSSIFSQLLSLFPRSEFQQLVRKHQAEKGAKGFTCWAQFTAMLFCQLAQAKSLREICDGLRSCLGKLAHIGLVKAPSRTTLSYANKHRPWKLYRDLFYIALDRCRTYAPATKFRFKNKLLSLDASSIELCLELFDWAKYRQKKGAIKLHLLLDHDGYLPTFAVITDGKTHEVTVARTMTFAPGTILAIDRGYIDYYLFNCWSEAGVWFVTRAKKNMAYRVVEVREIPQRGNILSDEIIEFTGYKARKECPRRMRRVTVWDKTNRKEIVLLTNHLDFGATTIGAIYKDRWQIETFFRTLKQNLKVKTFVGTTRNALLIQIWTALIAMLLLKFMQFRSKLGWSLSNLAALLRWNLFTYRDLNEWIDDPFRTPPLGPSPVQLDLLR